MQQYYRLDVDGYYIEPVIAEYSADDPMPDDITDIRPPDGLYRGRFDRASKIWVEDAPKPEAPEGMMAVWDCEAKVWSFEAIPEPPGEPGGQLSQGQLGYLDGMIAGSGGLRHE